MGNLEVENISTEVGIPVADDLGKYLGVPTLSRKVSKTTFQHVIDRVDKRLTRWRTKYLSLVGWITLVKSTLTIIPVYTIQTVASHELFATSWIRRLDGFSGQEVMRSGNLI